MEKLCDLDECAPKIPENPKELGNPLPKQVLCEWYENEEELVKRSIINAEESNVIQSDLGVSLLIKMGLPLNYF